MVAYYAEVLKAARENDKNKIEKVLSTAGDKKPKDLKIDDKPDIKEMFIDDSILSIDKNIGEDEKEFIHDLINATDFSHRRNLILTNLNLKLKTKKLNQWT